MSAGDRDELMAAYLLGELEGAELAEFERRLRDDLELRSEVDALRPVVTRLESLPEGAWTSPEPPPLTHPADTTDGQGAPDRQRPARRRWTPLRLGFAGAAAGVAILVAGIAIGGSVFGDADEDGPTGAGSIALAPLEGGDGSGELTVDRDDPSDAVLEVNGLAPNDGDYYEAWLLGERGLVSLGSFTVDSSGSASVPLRVPVDPARYDDFDVSLEPDDGDPAHSSDSVLRSDGTGTA
jgi:anti-sigma-K factor RskA